MSTGAVFQLVTNDGKQDKMLMASNLLHKRLLTISSVRESRNLDPTPTLADIERTHILFVNAHFKPFVALSYEYNKVIAPGTHTLGQKVDFNIPQFGDFFSDMVLNAKLTIASDTYFPFSTGVWDAERGSWTDVRDASTKWRWCDYPGERLIELAEFSVNGNPLDSYSPYATNVWREFYVQPNKKRGWDRCMGQQVEEKGYIDSRSSNVEVDSGLTSNESILGQNGIYSTGCQLSVGCTDGLQTPAYCHEKVVDLWIPLLFWFNTDFRLSIPSVAIPYGQRFISLTLANANKLIGFPFVNSQTAAFNGDPCDATKPSVPTSNLWTNSKLSVELTLYINNLFVNPEIHEIFIRRISFNLIRVHKEQTLAITKTQDNVWLNSLKWPIETLYVGMRSVDPSSNDEACHILNMEQWRTYTHNSYCQCIAPLLVGTAAVDIDLSTAGIAPSGNTPFIRVVKLDKQPVLKKVSVSAHGIKFYDNFPADFFNKYVPYRFGGPNVNTPEDKGLLMINFCLYPHSYQPSGHINVSRAREFYLDYQVTDAVAAEMNDGSASTLGHSFRLMVLASAINFLLISDGSAVLRYST